MAEASPGGLKQQVLKEFCPVRYIAAAWSMT